MDPETWKQVKNILDQVADTPPDRQPRRVAELCRDDHELRQEVLGFLELDGRADGFIDAPLWRVLPERATPAAKPDEDVHRIGPYRLERLLGKGGMGEVHLAVREDDYEQKVALKRSLGSVWRDELLTRFVTERQILANLQHPGIARLLDGGTDEDGFPYLVMEYVDGEPIDAYCDRHELDLQQRLRLMSEVCRIVHHAHKSLIVHRDLKPTNILVTDDGQPRLLDFGIAKLLDPDLDVAATARGKAVMTPACASPEQIMGEAVTTACDVYALGVLLYRLLTGRQPYDLSGMSFPRIRRTVCLRKIERPSLAVEDSDSLEPVDGQRPAASARRLRGDLDAIVLKAMRKEAEHRFTSAAEMADDIDRYLAGQPVRARKGNWYYYAGKYFRRNKPLVALMVLIVALAITSTALGWQAETARRSAVKAGESAEILKNVLVEILKAPAPNQAQGRDLTVREVLENAKPRIEDELDGRPELQAEMFTIMGDVFLQLGDPKSALALHQEALERQREFDPGPHSDLANMIANVGSAHYKAGDFPAAERAYRTALNMRQALGDDELVIALTLFNLTNVRNLSGQNDGIGEAHQKVLDIRRRHGAPANEIANSLVGLGVWELRAGDTAAAIQHLAEALEIRRDLGNRPSDLASVTKSLARAYHKAGQLAEARALYDEALELRTRLFGADHREVYALQPHLARLLLDLGEVEAAGALAREALSQAERVGPPEHRDIIVARSVVGACRIRSGERSAEAEAWLRAGARFLEARFGDQAFSTVWTQRQLSELDIPPVGL